MNALYSALLRPVEDGIRQRRYQTALDAMVTGWMEEADWDRGLLGTRGTALPHEDIPGFWRLPEDERRRQAEPVDALYQRNAGRAGTAKLCQAAFCWKSPLSRHRGDPRLLQFFAQGLRFFTDSIDTRGLMGACGLNGQTWAHGWDLEGLIYGLILVGEHLEPDLVAGAREAFGRAADRQAALEETPAVTGAYGNQRCVHALGLYLYGVYLDRPALITLSDQFWQDAMPRVMDASGQVIEQQGPCMHYSYTAFVYAWLNLAVRGDRSQDERVRRCLEWFRRRHTDSLYPMAGPSTRLYYEYLADAIGDLWPAAEQQAAAAPECREFVDRAMAARARAAGSRGGDGTRLAGEHGASILMWALLMTPTAPAEAPAAGCRMSPGEFTAEYKGMQLLKRSPLPYLLIHRRYQTHFNYTDYLPFAGLQTWALDGEPPIVHPTPLYPSTTVAEGVDTARQGASHNWGLFGAGAVGIDCYAHPPGAPGELWLVAARYHWLWRLVVFGELSTVMLEFGRGGARRTAWTLNRVEPAEPRIEGRRVRFAGRRACLHASLPPPRLDRPEDDSDPWAAGVRQLVYDAGPGPAAFALSDDSFQFEGDWTGLSGPLRFTDSTGRYELSPDPRFHARNPGDIRIDVFQLAYGSVARRLSPCNSMT